jgi:threonine dehydratase
MFSLDDLDFASRLLRPILLPTPQYEWPLLSRRYGTTIIVKHENHTPIGSFKVRGGLTYLYHLLHQQPDIKGVICATRGNHGQSIAYAGRHFGLKVIVVVPHGNAVEKNMAMAALGAEIVEYGADFDEAKERAEQIAAEHGFAFVPSFHPRLVSGVATYARELFTAAPDLEVIYAPIGLGSGICGIIQTRNLLNLRTEVVGVVSRNADAYRLSIEAGYPIATNSSRTFADGLAVRKPDTSAFHFIRQGVARIVAVSDDEIAEAIRAYHEDTHNLAEGAGAASLAGLAQERSRIAGRKAGVILSGANIDRNWAACVLAGGTPSLTPTRSCEARDEI